ncbi:MAG: amino acid permease, partial [Actinomycetota bacterium]|nr:amino acid permease [Actinomycetota bacterium]
PYGVLQGAGLLFFAFAGYARIATLGEEVRDPRRTIPHAIQVALGATVVIYTAIALALLSVLGATALAASDAPLSAAVQAGSWAAAGPIVGIGAATAALGALLALIAGVGRTTLAMARTGDLPHWLAAVHPRHQVPHHAEVTLAVAVCLLVLTLDLRGAIGFSSFGVLVYYLVANLSALRQRVPDRRFPRALQVVGAAGCVVLVATLPVSNVVAGVGVFALGVAYRGWQLATASRVRR